MIRVFINGLAASAGGGLTYLRNVIPEISRRDDVAATVLLTRALRREFESLPNVTFLEASDGGGSFVRSLREQISIPQLIRQSNSRVLISAGNFAVFRSPVPQILLSRNSLYTSPDFMRDLRSRREYGLWADTIAKGWVARKSVRRAEITVAPSEAFARELTAWTDTPVRAIHHGFDAAAFTASSAALPPAIQSQLNADRAGDSQDDDRSDDGPGPLRLLFVSHYNYYRNFETLFRAIPILRAELRRRQNGVSRNKVRLYFTCRLGDPANPGSYSSKSASALVAELRHDGDIVELGSVPYFSLHHLYRMCHVYVTPAYAESFAHPLVETMSSGLPVVASDTAVHREICGDAALYFSRFSPEELSSAVLKVADSPETWQQLSANGLRRAAGFSWQDHVSRLLDLAHELVGERSQSGSVDDRQLEIAS